MSIGAERWEKLSQETRSKIFVILTAPFAPLSRASVNTSSSSDAFVALKSHDIIAIHGVPAVKHIYSCEKRRHDFNSLGGVVLLAFASEKWTRAPLI